MFRHILAAVLVTICFPSISRVVDWAPSQVDYYYGWDEFVRGTLIINLPNGDTRRQRINEMDPVYDNPKIWLDYPSPYEIKSWYGLGGTCTSDGVNFTFQLVDQGGSALLGQRTDLNSLRGIWFRDMKTPTAVLYGEASPGTMKCTYNFRGEYKGHTGWGSFDFDLFVYGKGVPDVDLTDYNLNVLADATGSWSTPEIIATIGWFGRTLTVKNLSSETVNIHGGLGSAELRQGVDVEIKDLPGMMNVLYQSATGKFRFSGKVSKGGVTTYTILFTSEAL
ncbi:hypothetical protein YT21_24315 [Salmonella enterica subsp. enterica serovar Newport]|nr:hypothetical protein [Salmonella enterica subsp. enterica serovar Newport]